MRQSIGLFEIETKMLKWKICIAKYEVLVAILYWHLGWETVKFEKDNHSTTVWGIFTTVWNGMGKSHEDVISASIYAGIFVFSVSLM